jgi:hypothetical protein
VCWLRLIISLTLSLPSTLRPLYLSIPCSLVQSLSLTQHPYCPLFFSLLPPSPSLSFPLSPPSSLSLSSLYFSSLYFSSLSPSSLSPSFLYPTSNSLPFTLFSSCFCLSLPSLSRSPCQTPTQHTQTAPQIPYISLSLSPASLSLPLSLSFFTSLSLPPSSTLSLSIYLFISLLPIFFSLFLTQHSQIALPGSIFTKCFHN